MCELSQHYSRFQVIYHYWRNGRIPLKLIQIFNKKPDYGKCQSCGTSLSHSEMHPLGRCSRSMCQPCYDRIIADSQICAVCGEWLPSHQLSLIQSNPRELSYHVCNGDQHRGECFEYLVARHTSTVYQGNYPEFNGLSSFNSNYQAISDGSLQEDFLDAEYEDITPKALSPGHKSLGPAVTQQCSEFFESMRNPRIKIER